MKTCWEYFVCANKENYAVFPEKIDRCWEYMDAAGKCKPATACAL